MRTPSAWAIVVLVILVLLLFGASKLPDIAGSIGKSLKVFKREVKELREDDDTPRHDQSSVGPDAGQTPPGTPAQQPPDRAAGHLGRPGEGHHPPQT